MLSKYFGLPEKGTTVKTEIVAGLTTFLTMAYIIFVNPAILSDAGMDKQSLIIVTCLVSGVMTIITGFFSNAPIAMAPGMGLNAFLAYTLVLNGKITWQAALGVVFLSGLLCWLLTLLGLRKRLVEAIPVSLISAISVGIGLFITFIGLRDLGVIVKNEATLVSAGPLTCTVVMGLCGLLLMAFLAMKKVKGALLIGMLFSTVLAVVAGFVQRPERLVSLDFDITPVAFKLDIIGALKWSLFGNIFALMFIDMFDSIGTLVACCHEAKMVDEKGTIKGLDRLLQIDAAASMLGAAMGTSSIASYIESASGIEEGGRTGLTSIVTGLCFLAALLFVPLVGIVPKYATAPALIMVGLFMMKEVRKIDFADMEEAFPLLHHHGDDLSKLQHQHGPCLRVYLVHTDQSRRGQGEGGKAGHVDYRHPVHPLLDPRPNPRSDSLSKVFGIGLDAVLKSSITLAAAPVLLFCCCDNSRQTVFQTM